MHQLIRDHQDIWLRFCAGMLGQLDQAFDAAQETALRICQRTPPKDISFTAWSLGIARNVCLEQIRSHARHRNPTHRCRHHPP